MARPVHHGISRLSVIAALLCVVILFAIALPLANRYRRDRLFIKDSAQLKEIHQAWITFAHEYKGRYPVPGLIDRRPDPILGDMDGTGPEDSSLNTTANLYSAMIAQDYFNPDTFISTFERNPAVEQYKDYDYNAYDPANDVYWDPNFVADLETGSNVSYAHVPLVGDRLVLQWRNTSGANVAVVGNRGPADGVASADSYSCRKDGSWRGNLVFNDNHLETLSATAGLKIGGGPDNLFNVDPDLNGLGQVLAFTKEVKDNQAVLQHD
ncbi:MAG: hypothetical protein O7C65_01515 [Planctomycetota bacterium]|nr:hypothetical protein [Planctomycetota bacterium]